MATITPETLRGPDRLDRALGFGTLAMLAIMLVALARGFGRWDEVPWPVWLHMVTIGVALVLTPVLLWRRRGDTRHRWLGYVWAVSLLVTALDSFLVREIRPGRLSPIHLISVFVLWSLVRMVRAARRHDLATHRWAVRGMVMGGLLTAGLFTLPFGRMLGRWLMGG